LFLYSREDLYVCFMGGLEVLKVLRVLFCFLLVFSLFPTWSVSADSEEKFDMVTVTLSDLKDVQNIHLNETYLTTLNGEEVTLNSGSYSLSTNNGIVEVYNEDNSLVANGEQLKIEPETYSFDHTITIGNNSYLGSISTQDGVLVNNLPLEHYLYGVVPAEIGEGSLEEAFRTQAIAARTFAYANSTGLDNTVSSLVYRGYDPMSHPNSIQAVNDTAGEVLVSYPTDKSGGLARKLLEPTCYDYPAVRAIYISCLRVGCLDSSGVASWVG